MKTYKKIDKAREEGNKNMSFLKTRKSHINKTVQFDKTVNFDKTVPFDKTNPIDFASWFILKLIFINQSLFNSYALLQT